MLKVIAVGSCSAPSLRIINRWIPWSLGPTLRFLGISVWGVSGTFTHTFSGGCSGKSSKESFSLGDAMADSAAAAPTAPTADVGGGIGPDVIGLAVDTLREALDMGLVENPPLCTWGGWQAWRGEAGARPPIPMP